MCYVLCHYKPTSTSVTELGMTSTYDNGGGGVHSWIVVCAYTSQGSDMLEVLSVSIEAATGEKPCEAWKAFFHHPFKSL